MLAEPIVVIHPFSYTDTIERTGESSSHHKNFFPLLLRFTLKNFPAYHIAIMLAIVIMLYIHP